MRIGLRPINWFVAIALYSFAIQFALAQKPVVSPQGLQQIASGIDSYMNDSVKVDNFSGTILVARNGQPIFSKGYGMANFELNVPNTPQSVFRIGSNTKQFTAMAIMMLQERGKLSINESICKYLADCTETWKPVTIRHLLTHTSGIINFIDLPEYGKISSCRNTQKSIIETFKNKPLEFTPGEKFSYSNSGYYLLGEIIEQVSGEDYDEFLQKNIFTPLGMKNTGYESPRLLIKNRASGYSIEGNRVFNAFNVDMSNAFAAGALISTTEDLLLWDNALYTEKLVSRKSLYEMLTPFQDFLPGAGYAYGWEVGKQFDRSAISHSGHIAGFSSYIIRFPAERVVVIVLSNNVNAPSPSIGNALSAIVFSSAYKSPNERKTIALEQQTLEKYAGQYQLTPDRIITVTVINKRIFGQITGLTNVNLELFPKSETDFFFKHIDAQVTFIKDAQEKVSGLTIFSDGSSITAQKIK